MFVSVCDGVLVGVAPNERLEVDDGVPDPVNEGVTEEVPDSDDVREPVRVPDSDGDVLGEFVDVGESDGVCEGDRVSVTDGVTEDVSLLVPETDPVPLRVNVTVGVPVGDAPWERVEVGDAVKEGVEDGEFVRDTVREGVNDDEDVNDGDTVRETVFEGVIDCVSGDFVNDGDGVIVRVCDRDFVGVTVGVNDCVVTNDSVDVKMSKRNSMFNLTLERPRGGAGEIMGVDNIK